MRTIKQGDKGSEVMLLQRLLNKRGASPRLTEDADFGPKTKAAAIAFQAAKRVVPPDGVVSPTTWAKFGHIAEFVHAVTLRGQPSSVTCWSAAATMVLGPMSVGSGAAATTSSGELASSLPNVETFVMGAGLRVINQQSMPGVSTLLAALASGPAWIGFQGAHFEHAVVFSGIWSDRAEDGSGTVLRVHDPWPPGRGTIYSTTYVDRQVTLRSTPHRLRAMIQYVAGR